MSIPLKSIPVFYSDKMVAEAQSFSPSATKPQAVVASWQSLGLPIEVHSPPPVTREDLYRAHDRPYVDGVLDLRVANGFENRSASVAASLPYTSGAMLAAARAAIANRAVACAPCSGFHHASYGQSAGFCTFNGLVVAAQALRAAKLAEYVGILDFDQHYGDGTDDIIWRLKLNWIRHYSAGEHYHDRTQAREFLGRIADRIRAMADCDVILYQAGADPHVDDPLGGWLTTEQLLQRDRRVFEAARSHGVPLAWNLAGGYQTPLRKVLDIHDNTMIACANIFLGDKPHEPL
jgi:acetoin utilization deacetylase AcuC-like enzyme